MTNNKPNNITNRVIIAALLIVVLIQCCLITLLGFVAVDRTIRVNELSQGDSLLEQIELTKEDPQGQQSPPQK